jgi:hypothetical protein
VIDLYGYANNEPVDAIDSLGLAPKDMGSGYSARVDNFNTGGSSAYEIHVYDSQGNELGIFNQNGLIPKHGFNSMPSLPDEVGIKLNQNRNTLY